MMAFFASFIVFSPFVFCMLKFLVVCAAASLYSSQVHQESSDSPGHNEKALQDAIVYSTRTYQLTYLSIGFKPCAGNAMIFQK